MLQAQIVRCFRQNVMMRLVTAEFQHLYEVDQEAKRQVEELTLLLVSESGIDESLKNTDPLCWVQEMNLAKTSAEEIVLREYVYV